MKYKCDFHEIRVGHLLFDLYDMINSLDDKGDRPYTSSNSDFDILCMGMKTKVMSQLT